MPRLRQNIVTNDWVVIAPERSKRPQDFVQAASAKRTTKKECPFCVEANQAYKTNIKEAETDNIYVIPNLYPAFVNQDEVTLREGPYYPSYKSLGGHEVIVLKDHDTELCDLKRPILEEYYHVYQERINFYRDNPTIEYAMVIHNYGAESGASIEHPHSQLFASSIVPPLIKKEVQGSQRFFQDKKQCVFCWLVEQEKAKKIRVVAENDFFLAFTFWASRFPFETWVIPKEHQPFFEEINRTERLALAEIFLTVLGKINNALNLPPYNYFIHTTPPRMEEAGKVTEYFHWHLEIVPRVSHFGGYELGSGLVIDVVSPEKAALFLNEGTERDGETYA